MKKLKVLQRHKHEIILAIAFILVFFIAPKISFTYFYGKASASYRGLGKIRGAPLVLYEYQVNGKIHKGNFEKFNISNERLEKFKKGDSLTIRYVTFLPFFSKFEKEDNK